MVFEISIKGCLESLAKKDGEWQKRGDKKVVGVAKVGWRKKGGGGKKVVAKKRVVVSFLV